MAQVVSPGKMVVQHIFPYFIKKATIYGYDHPSITSSLQEKAKVQVVEGHIDHQQEVLQILIDYLAIIGWNNKHINII